MLVRDRPTVVLIADAFNLSIFNQLWLSECGILTKEEITDGQTLISPVAVNVVTTNYELLIVQERLQLTISREFENPHQLINRVVGGVVRTLPHTGYSGLGFNFTSTVLTSDENSLARLQELFMSQEHPLHERFLKSDSRFGSYMSTSSLHGSRLNLDTKPVRINQSDEAQRMTFNYHFDLQNIEDRIELIEGALNRWTDFDIDAFELSQSFEDYICGGG